MTVATVTILFRGFRRDVEYVERPAAGIVWWFPGGGAITPDTTEYEQRAIDAICARDLADRRREWCAQLERRRAAQADPLQRRAL